jgi:hypothetical protein
MTRSLTLSVATGLVIGAIAWIDPLFVPLVLAGPIISGAAGGLRGIPLRWLALVWVVAGISMIVSDWALNHEDRLFHTVLTLVMVGLVALGWFVGARIARRRSTRLAMP